MMTSGEAEIDMASLDPKRYGEWITTEYSLKKMRSATNTFIFCTILMKNERPADP